MVLKEKLYAYRVHFLDTKRLAVLPQFDLQFVVEGQAASHWRIPGIFFCIVEGLGFRVLGVGLADWGGGLGRRLSGKAMVAE